MSKSKLCYGCRAMWGQDNEEYCYLGFKTKQIKDGNPYVYILNLVPMEPCPKPKTWKELHQLEKLRGK